MIFGGQHLSVRLGSTSALTDVSVEVPSGAVTSVVGGDGAGKTTLLRCLVGQIAPDRGVVHRPHKPQVGYMPSSSGSWSDLTVDENIDFVANVYGLSGEALAMRRQHLLRSTGLDHAGSRLARQLSGGMRRKLAFVMASLHRPQLLVLDEPTTGIDPVSRVELWRLIAEAAAEGAAVVMATTYLDEAERASSILVLNRGQVVLQGSPDEIMASVPGRIVEIEAPSDGMRAWRRGPIFHQLLPEESPEPSQGVLAPALHSTPPEDPGQPAHASVTPDLEDAIIVRMLAEVPTAQAHSRRGISAPTRLAAQRIRSMPDGRRETTTDHEERPVRALAQNVTKNFGEFTAVADVSLEVRAGEVVGLIGANGAGKTTLIRMLLALVDTSAGRVELFGAKPSRQGRHRLGYVPQGLGLYTDLTVAQNVEFVAGSFGISPADIELSDELHAVRQQLVGEIGLGRQRRLAFACALGHRPELLVLDEPTSGIDALARVRLWDMIHEQAATGVGVLVTTHDMQEAKECDRIVIMAASRVVESGALTQIIDGKTALEIHSDDWAQVFNVLNDAGLPVMLAGRRVRVSQTAPAAVDQALQAARVDARVTEVPATLEETLLSVANS